MNQKLKICGVRNIDMFNACINHSVDYLGINFVPSSRRCVSEKFYQYLLENYSKHTQFITPFVKGRMEEGFSSKKNPSSVLPLKKEGGLVAVFMNQSLDEIYPRLESGIFSILQLHGDESPAFCAQIKAKFPHVKIWKALKVKSVGANLRVCPEKHTDSVGANGHSPLQTHGTSPFTKGRTKEGFVSEKNPSSILPLKKEGGFKNLKLKIKNYASIIDDFIFDGPNPGNGESADFIALKQITDFCDNFYNHESSFSPKTMPKKIRYGIAGGIHGENLQLFRETFPQADFFDTASGVEVAGEFCEEKLKSCFFIN